MTQYFQTNLATYQFKANNMTWKPWQRQSKTHPYTTDSALNLPANWDRGTLAQVTVRRRQPKRHKGVKYPSGWDLVDSYTGDTISEFNDETAAPPEFNPERVFTKPYGRINRPGQEWGRPENGSELGELFQAVYTLLHNTTMETLHLLAEAIKTHELSGDGQPIISVTLSAYTKLGHYDNV